MRRRHRLAISLIANTGDVVGHLLQQCAGRPPSPVAVGALHRGPATQTVNSGFTREAGAPTLQANSGVVRQTGPDWSTYWSEPPQPCVPAGCMCPPEQVEPFPRRRPTGAGGWAREVGLLAPSTDRSRGVAESVCDLVDPDQVVEGHSHDAKYEPVSSASLSSHDIL
jgi:hypothetical protein